MTNLKRCYEKNSAVSGLISTMLKNSFAKRKFIHQRPYNYVIPRRIFKFTINTRVTRTGANKYVIYRDRRIDDED